MDDGEGSSPGVSARVRVTCSVHFARSFRLLLELGTCCEIRVRVRFKVRFTLKFRVRLIDTMSVQVQRPGL